MKKFFAMTALALSLTAVGAAANAATTALTFTNDTTSFGNSYGTGTTGTAFTDNYTFSYSSAFDVSSAVISIALNSTSALNISNFTLTNTSTGASYSGTGTSAAGIQYYTINASNLASGSYQLSVAGSVTGSAGGSYGGNISVSAVPEASTTAMMLGGLALVGFVATRRRRSNEKMSVSFSPSLAAA